MLLDDLFSPLSLNVSVCAFIYMPCAPCFLVIKKSHHQPQRHGSSLFSSKAHNYGDSDSKSSAAASRVAAKRGVSGRGRERMTSIPLIAVASVVLCCLLMAGGTSSTAELLDKVSV